MWLGDCSEHKRERAPFLVDFHASRRRADRGRNAAMLVHDVWLSAARIYLVVVVVVCFFGGSAADRDAAPHRQMDSQSVGGSVRRSACRIEMYG